MGTLFQIVFSSWKKRIPKRGRVRNTRVSLQFQIWHSCDRRLVACGGVFPATSSDSTTEFCWVIIDFIIPQVYYRLGWCSSKFQLILCSAEGRRSGFVGEISVHSSALKFELATLGELKLLISI